MGMQPLQGKIEYLGISKKVWQGGMDSLNTGVGENLIAIVNRG